jgi:hypothetical protein
MTNWATVADLGTALGTLILAVATFAAVRASQRSDRLAERALLVQLRPLLLPTRLEEPPDKIGFLDDYWVRLPGGHALAEVTEEVIYLAITLRNVGSGLAVLNGWCFYPQRLLGPGERPDPSTFHRLTRDLYIPVGDRGFWQGTFRDPKDPAFGEAAGYISKREPFSVDVLYGDAEGTQRIITRFVALPDRDQSWVTTVAHHWYLDHPDPR